MLYNHIFSKFKAGIKISLVTRLISALLFISLHPTLAYAQSPVVQTPVAVVAVIDEGVYNKHPDLESKMWKNKKEIPNNFIDDDKNGYVDDGFGWNFLDNDNNLSPKGGHGTKLAGLIAPSADIMPLIACGKEIGCGQSAIIDAIYYAVDNGANVINLSLGDTSGYKNAYDDAIKYAYKHNVVIVASSGSSEVGYSLALEPMSPICNDNGENMVLGVGTVDETGNRPAWANFGRCIDVSAQGTNIYTTLNPDFSNNQVYGYAEGNSFATAKVSNLAAMVIAKNPNISAKDVISSIKNNSGGKNLSINIEKTLNNQTIQKPKVLGASVKIYTKTAAKRPRLIIR